MNFFFWMSCKNRNRYFFTILSFLLIGLLFAVPVSAQYVFNQSNLSQQRDIYAYAKYVDVGKQDLSLNEVINNSSLKFLPIPKQNYDFGFTTHHFWVQFKLENSSNEQVVCFFETARPITDIAELYIVNSTGKVNLLKNGDKIPFSEKNFAHRKAIFKIKLNPSETQNFYLHLKSDGELLSLPMMLHTQESMIEETSFEQFVFGFFYGLLAIASILYLFFFFAMQDKVFLYYSIYVVFIGLLQFSIDGYFYEFITPQPGWLSLHSVILFAVIANFFLGRYAQIFLKIGLYSRVVTVAFYILYALDFMCFFSLIFIPRFLAFSYPVANLLGLVLLFLIIVSQIIVFNKTRKIYYFFSTGILFLISGFVIFILKNFGVLPLTFWTENASKLGTGMEVLFLSLSMANLIRSLKNERQELQNQALQRSEEMNEMKSYFLSNISHELRTPLNAIMSLSDSLNDETDILKVKESSKSIKYSSESLLSSVNDILDFSKIEKNELKLEQVPFDPVKVLDIVKSRSLMLAESKNIGMSFNIAEDFPDFILGDGVRFEQIINNVINNAIKFTSEGQVEVKCDLERLGNQKVRIVLEVTDTGVGIQKEKMESIFDSFSQETINNKRRFGGLGLGLYIVKTLVDMHQGHLKITSRPGQGTRCNIELDFEIFEKNTSTQNISGPEYDLQGKRILVVEDNAMNQMVVKTITKKWSNTEIEFANNGKEGISILKEKDFDIILMDLHMPVMDGYEATIAIRNGHAGESNKNIPIIAVTADVTETTQSRVLEIGMNRHVSKPLDKDSLFNYIQACF
ncbi:ATP-binding protein [Flavobacterium amniphilum]|uniref:hybrid sensor histidine kinase/response regulator n=1 Tax=Flavobacterium amniphilum TaxID=1834035 RepID=UPI00202A8956|nr:hybrid sensor histidine kinase/response regulator [Flavobacterium amniphilum]MCL9807271.1 ATP-binding protein [Flavobacterium amniphilum]